MQMIPIAQIMMPSEGMFDSYDLMWIQDLEKMYKTNGMRLPIHVIESNLHDGVYEPTQKDAWKAEAARRAGCTNVLIEIVEEY